MTRSDFVRMARIDGCYVIVTGFLAGPGAFSICDEDEKFSSDTLVDVEIGYDGKGLTEISTHTMDDGACIILF